MYARSRGETADQVNQSSCQSRLSPGGRLLLSHPADCEARVDGADQQLRGGTCADRHGIASGEMVPPARYSGVDPYVRDYRRIFSCCCQRPSGVAVHVRVHRHIDRQCIQLLMHDGPPATAAVEIAGVAIDQAVGFLAQKTNCRSSRRFS